MAGRQICIVYQRKIVHYGNLYFSPYHTKDPLPPSSNTSIPLLKTPQNSDAITMGSNASSIKTTSVAGKSNMPNRKESQMTDPSKKSSSTLTPTLTPK